MARLVRMDRTGHTTLAEWSGCRRRRVRRRGAAFREQLEAGYYAVVSEGEGQARQVTALPADAEPRDPAAPDRGRVSSAARSPSAPPSPGGGPSTRAPCAPASACGP